MGKKNKIYTKTGDDGTTGLVGGSRVQKFDLRLESYGTVDELNSTIGVILSYEVHGKVKEVLQAVQNKLFNIGSRLASDNQGDAFTVGLSITASDIDYLEKSIDIFQNELPELTKFILPGGTPAAARCHVARTVCRRAERRILQFAQEVQVQPEIIKYINRLSDLLFVMARKINHDTDIEEMPWKQ